MINFSVCICCEWFNFTLGLNFILFLGMVMYDNQFETKKKKKIKPMIKLNHIHYIFLYLTFLLPGASSWLSLTKVLSNSSMFSSFLFSLLGPDAISILWGASSFFWGSCCRTVSSRPFWPVWASVSVRIFLGECPSILLHLTSASVFSWVSTC